MTPAQAADITQAESLLAYHEPEVVIADKGYDKRAFGRRDRGTRWGGGDPDPGRPNATTTARPTPISRAECVRAILGDAARLRLRAAVSPGFQLAVLATSDRLAAATGARSAPALAAHVHGATYGFFLAPTAPDSGRALLTLSAPGDAMLAYPDGRHPRSCGQCNRVCGTP
jgi:hypothetical protein